MKTILLLCMSLTPLVSGQEFCSTDDCGVPSMLLAMLGYDVGLSDPYSYPDPGHKGQIFSPTTRDDETGELIKHGFIHKALQEIVCRGDYSIKTFKSYFDYMNEKSQDLEWDIGGSYEASGGFMGFSAEVSASYKYSETTNEKSVKTFFKEVQGEIEQATAVCQYYIVEKSDLVEPMFTTGFKRYLVEIDKAAKSNDELFKDELFTSFIKAFGTHYQVTTKLGAKYIFQRMYETRAQSASERNERSQCAKHEAEACGGGGFDLGELASAEAKACLRGSHKICKAKIEESSKLEERGIDSKRVIAVGSAAVQSIDKWAEEVGKFGGVVLKFKLNKITHLFKQNYFEANGIKSENGELLNPQLMATFINDRMTRYCELMLGKSCPEPLTGCGIMGSCGDNEKCIPDHTKEHGYRCEVKPTLQERKSCEDECRQKASSFSSKCGLYQTKQRTTEKYGCGFLWLGTCSRNRYSYSTDYGSAEQCKANLDATCQAKCENKKNYDGLTKKLDREVTEISNQIKNGTKNILRNVQTVQKNQVKLLVGQLDLKDSQMKIIQNQFKLSTGQNVLKKDVTKVISNQLIQKMNQNNLLLGQKKLQAGQSTLNAGQKAIKANQVKIMLEQESWFRILSNSQKTMVKNQLQILVNQDILIDGQEEIKNKLIATSTQILSNQESWFQILNTQQKDLLHGQTNQKFNQNAILRDTKKIIADLDLLQDTVNELSIFVKYIDEIENLENIKYWYKQIPEGPSGDMVLGYNSNSFKDAALHARTGIQASLNKLNNLLTGGGSFIASQIIYETNKPNFCKDKVFEYFDNLLSISGVLLNTGTFMANRTLHTKVLKTLKMYQIDHESQYIQSCGCKQGFRRGQRIDLNSFVSILEKKIPLQSRIQVFEEVLSLKETGLMAKMLIIHKHFNFNLNNATIDMVRKIPIEDIATLIMISLTSPNPQEDFEIQSEKYSCYKDEDYALKTSPTGSKFKHQEELTKTQAQVIKEKEESIKEKEECIKLKENKIKELGSKLKDLEELTNTQAKISAESGSKLKDLEELTNTQAKVIKEKEKKIKKLGAQLGHYLIQSLGGAAQHQPRIMGNYTHTGDIIRGYPVYENDGMYLYVAPLGYWTVAPNTSLQLGELFHTDRDPTPSTPPIVGWRYLSNGWHEDTTLTITHIGGDKQLSVFYRVSSSGETANHQSSKLTDYYPTGDTVNLFPVFRRGGKYLYVSTAGNWMIGDTAGGANGWIRHLQKKDEAFLTMYSFGLKPTMASRTPPVTGWEYWNGADWMEDSSLNVTAAYLH